MSRATGLSASLALPVVALLWYPALVAPAAIVGGLVASLTLALGSSRRGTPRTITSLPTRWEQQHGARWLPGLGVGFGLRWPPQPIIYIWRRRR